MDEDFIIERRMRELRPLFTSSLKEPTLCTHLFSQSVITEQDATKVRTTMQYDTFQASEELMDCVLRSKEPGKWTSFLDALQVTGYEHIRQSLMSPNDDDDERTAHINRTIQHFTKDLAEGMVGDIPIIVPILFSKNILSEVDKDNILCELTNKGGYQAGLMLFDRIKCRAMPTKWYGGFLQALLDANGDELVKLIEPDFIYKGEALFKKVDSRNLDNVAGPEENIYEHVISAAGDVEMDTNNFAVPPVSPRTCSPDVSTSNQPKQIHFDNSTDSSQQNVKQDTFIFRYQYLLIKLGTEVLRKLFDVKTGNDVAKHLIAKRQDIQDLIKAKIITSDQKQLLPPIDNQPDSSNFDISLLACLLRNICGLRHPKDPVWMNPAQGDTSVEADITRLRLCRNQLMHSDKLRLPDSEFESKWKDLSKILIDLNKVCGIAQLKSDIENAKSIDIDERLNGQFNTTIKAWYDSDRQLNQRIDEVSSKINNVRSEVDNVRSEVTNVKSEVTNVKQDLVGVISEVTNMKQDMVAVKRKLDVGSTPQQEIKKQHVESDNDGPENGDESSADNTTRSDSEKSQGQPYKLRRYQTELAEHGIKGNNTIVCSETGSGKTFVALEIIKRHFEDKKGLRKVAYMAKTCVLLEHQYGNIDKYLSIKTKLITGEGEDSMQLDMFMNKYDIIFLTPQILVNSLDRQAVKSLSDFSLLIFDECQHTRGDEPYINLMRKYLVEKFENVHGLPQIVGLTASIGIGKSRNDDEAVDYILKVMACLDVRILSTVEKNIEDLGKFINLPAEETIPLLDDNGPCKNILLEAIEDIENLLLDPALKQHSMVDKILECLDKGSQAYNNWTMELNRIAQLNVDDISSRDIGACARYLNTYSTALEVNKLLRLKDVLNYIGEKHKDDGVCKLKHTEMEKTLFQKLLDVLKKLRNKCKDTENPNVRTVIDTLHKMLNENGEDPRAMVFVKTRATCRALAEILDRELSMSGYQTSKLYGKDNRGGVDGMDESEQTVILRKFCEGDFKVLVCTPIVNEGIDVPQCNIVLSYECSGNEITKIQMQGRARAKEATIVLIGQEKTIEHDCKNVYKVARMNRALKKIKELEPNYIEETVKKFQREEVKKHRFKVETEKYKQMNKTDEDYDILCGKCDVVACLASNVRREKTYYVVINKDIFDKIERKPHKKPSNFDGFDKKYTISCKRCGYDWGNLSIFMGTECPVLQIRNIRFRHHRTGKLSFYKKWNLQPYNVPELTVDEVTQLR